MAGIALKYKNGQMPENIAEILADADKQDLEVLVALMMASDESGSVSDADLLCNALGAPKSAVEASLKFWRGAGIVGSARATASVTHAKEEKEAIATAHKGGAIEKSNSVSSYATEELAALFEKRIVTAQFIEEAQRVAGKTFNSYDTGILAGLVDQLGFEEEAVLHILSYVTRIGKKGIRYSEKLALSFYDEGITSAHEVCERISLIERTSETVYKIKQLYGMGSRELSKTEKQTFERWTQKFGYDIDVIRMAYDITVDSIQKPVPKYSNTILERWYGEGLRTAEQIKEYEESQKSSRDGATQKSYDLDDFFEAALQRSFEDLK